MQNILQFLQEQWPSLIFGAVAVVVIGWFYRLTRVARSEYLSRAAGFSDGREYNEDTLAIVRHVVGAIAGILAIKGYFGEDLVEVVIGLAVGVAILFMSWNGLDKDGLQDKLQGILRHLVTFLGGAGILGGEAIEQQWLTIGGIVISALGLLWSLIKKKEKVSIQ